MVTAIKYVPLAFLSASHWCWAYRRCHLCSTVSFWWRRLFCSCSFSFPLSMASFSFSNYLMPTINAKRKLMAQRRGDFGVRCTPWWSILTCFIENRLLWFQVKTLKIICELHVPLFVKLSCFCIKFTNLLLTTGF